MRWIAAVPPLLWALFTSGVPSTAAAKAPASMTANDANSALFAEIFSDIQSYYIEPMSLSGLAQAGLDALGGSADVFAVALDDKTVYFHHRGEVLGQAARPADDDAFGWGAVIAVGIDQAKAVTPGLGQAGDDDVDETVVDGMLKKFDRFSRYSSPEPAQAQRDNRDGFGGIGIGIDQTDPLPRVTDVFAGGPAADAGIAIDDHLVAIDGKLLNGLGRDAVVDMLRGPIASTVDVAVRRQGAAIPLTFHLTRALIVPPTVTREAAGRGILALRISEFNAETSSSLDAALQEAKRHTPEPLRGVIIDLRGNPGGLLAKGGGVDSASLFLDRGDIVSTRGRNPGSMQHFVADNHDVTGGLPLVILVNGGSASAAEVMAAALQDQGRAVVIGSASYGKGTVQEVNDLRNGAELTLTWARLFPPDGYLLHTHGVIPQFCTSRPGESLEAEIDEGVHPRDPLQMLPRARLDDGQWATLRSHCPPTSAENPHDMELARRLLGDPKIYAAALKGPAATIARSAGD
jgi:carboxyl-terminal processing protease